MPRWVFVALVLLSGCPLCQCTNSLHVVEGDEVVPVNGRLVLELDSEGFHAGPGNCGGLWYVDGVLGGNAELGTITTCGEYYAPPIAPPRELLIEATKYELGQCADCCPYGQLRVRVVAP